jgi:propanol-preferring alcohol dehydrogenase
MKALRLSNARPAEEFPLREEELQIPEPGAGQLRLRVAICGVCRTDLHLVEEDIHPPSLPVTPGHQAVGLVEQAGQALIDLKRSRINGEAILRIGQKWR